MPLQRLSKEAEARILDAIERVNDILAGSASDDPNPAITKVAQEENFPPNYIRLLAHGMNTGRVNARRKSGRTLLEKSATFPLAHADAIIAELYPTPLSKRASVASDVVSDEYSESPRGWLAEYQIAQRIVPLEEKTAAIASPVKTGRPFTADRAIHLLQDYRRVVADIEQDIEASRIKLAECLHTLDGYFRVKGEQFPIARRHSAAAWGVRANHLFDQIVAGNPALLKQGSTGSLVAFSLDKEPFKTVASALAAATAWQEAQEHWEKVANDPRVETIQKHYLPGTWHKEAADDKPADKGGGFFKKPLSTIGNMAYKQYDAFQKGVGSEMSRQRDLLQAFREKNKSRWSPEPNPNREFNRAAKKLNDPAHLANLQHIRAQAMLHDLVSNDEILSEHDDHDIHNAYHELLQLAPRAMLQPSIARAMLKTHLAQGSIDSHQLGQLADLENNIKKRDDPNAKHVSPLSQMMEFSGRAAQPRKV